jgi:uncharacterized protein with von Willebrand factor type A (vWA) domain
MSGSGGELTSRERVGRLCQILWARTPEEARLILRVVEDIPRASSEEIADFERDLAGLSEYAERSAILDPPGEPFEAQPAAAGEEIRLAVAFEPGRTGTGLALPRLRSTEKLSEHFVMDPQTVVSSRALAVLWRRFRRLERSGPKTELDLNATIEERSRRGFVPQPVMRARRVNRARLVILIDASNSMAPWRPFLDSIETSMLASRLVAPDIFYFNNVPRRAVHRTIEQSDPLPVLQALRQRQGASLLIVSDAGAARGTLNHKRVKESAEFLANAARLMRSIVWLNPMPRARWVNTSAGRLASRSGAVFLPLDVSSLILAVDVLRGARAA